MSSACTQCGGTDIEYDQSRGDAVCTGCGCVLEDNIIVSEITFAEKSSGASSVVGQFVSSEGSKVHLGGSGFRHGMSKDSREITISQAKKRISNLGHMLKLNQHCIDSALMFFKMALGMNLTRGRKSSIVDTACLYLVCRSEGTPHLLLDFSDVLQINVYSLGRAYLRLANALHIKPPAIDPCLYIHRFAHKLELGDKTHEVSMTALRLVARMKRDWIHHGRRPSGLCGAALLVSSRLHNFNRSVREVARVVKLSDGTLRKRLGDFKDTASSRLTIDEFLKIDLEQEHDPPSYLEGKKKAKQKGFSGEGEGEESGGEEEDDMEEDDSLGGFSGIRNQSVDDIITKARFTESFLSMSASVGLTNNLDALARLGEEEEGSASPDNDSQGMDELCTDNIDDDEIEQMLLSEEEVKIKSQLWFAENGDFLKERELKREKQALEKAEKEKHKKSRSRGKRPKVQQQQQTYNNAGEAIGKMLVEKRISTKLNYDVLRDMEIDSGPLGHTSHASDESASNQTNPISSIGQASAATGDLTITRTPMQPRLPSLTSRKRDFSSFSGLSPLPSRSNHPLTRSVESSSAKRTKVDPVSPSPAVSKNRLDHDVLSGGSMSTASGSCDPDMVVEESGPVEYCDDEEGEGLDDEEMEDLIYEDDPLLANSDTEDYGGDY